MARKRRKKNKNSVTNKSINEVKTNKESSKKETIKKVAKTNKVEPKIDKKVTNLKSDKSINKNETKTNENIQNPDTKEMEELLINTPKTFEYKKSPTKETIKEENIENNNKDDDKSHKHATNLILIFLIALLVFILMLPEDNNNNDNYYYYQDESSSTESAEESTMNATSFFSIGASEVDFNDIKITNVSFDGTNITMYVSSDTVTDLSSKDYYLEFYENQSRFIGRRIIEGNANSTVTINTNGINIDSNTYLLVSHVADNAIPVYNLHNDNSGYGKLVCTKDNLEYTYGFDKNLLTKTSIKETITNPDLNALATQKMDKQKIVNDYNKIDGLTANTTDGENSFIFMLEIDLNKIKNTKNIDYNYIYSKSERPNVIKFKMESRGYTCHE